MTAQTLTPAPVHVLSATLTTVPQLCERARHWRHAVPSVAQAVPRRALHADDTLATGSCGWFDSSHELVQGLQVLELSTPESLAEALPLSAWLQLNGCRAERPA
jgi:hypothetical protein